MTQFHCGFSQTPCPLFSWVGCLPSLLQISALASFWFSSKLWVQPTGAHDFVFLEGRCSTDCCQCAQVTPVLPGRNPSNLAHSDHQGFRHPHPVIPAVSTALSLSTLLDYIPILMRYIVQDILEKKHSSVQSLSHVRPFRPHESQHARTPCPSPTPRVHSDSCPLSQWCHLAIASSVVPFSSCPLPALESFPMSQLFTWGGQSTGVSALASFLPKNTQGWSPSEWTGRNSLQSNRLSRVFSNTTVQTHQFFSTQLSSQSNSHIHTWPLEKP